MTPVVDIRERLNTDAAGRVDGLRLPVKTVDELIEESGREVPWLIENFLARGEVTDIAGLAKFSGKTTAICHAIAAGAQGKEFAGMATKPAKYLYLTEQGNNFAEAIREAGLDKYEEYLRIVQYKDVAGTKWKELYQHAAEDVAALGFDAMVIDTSAKFSQFKENQESESGAVGERMRHISYLAQTFNIGVIHSRHAGKNGQGRGSSLFDGEADVCVLLKRPEGNHAKNIRKLEVIGRHGEWDLNVELTGGEYVALGTDDRIEFNRAVKLVEDSLPMFGVNLPGMTEKELALELEDRVGKTTLNEVIKWLCERERVVGVARQDSGRRGPKPMEFWKSGN
jgi:hypothetical protein